MDLEAPVYALASGEYDPPQIQGIVPTPSTTRENWILLKKIWGRGNSIFGPFHPKSSKIIRNHQKSSKIGLRVGGFSTSYRTPTRPPLISMIVMKCLDTF